MLNVNELLVLVIQVSYLVNFCSSVITKTYGSFDGCEPSTNGCLLKKYDDFMKYSAQGLDLDVYKNDTSVFHKEYTKCNYNYFSCGYVPLITTNSDKRTKANGRFINDYGVHIGTGLNLRFLNSTFIEDSLGIDKRISTILTPYFGLKGKTAYNFLLENNLRLADNDTNILLEKAFLYCYDRVKADFKENVTDFNFLRALTSLYYDCMNTGVDFKVKYKDLFNAIIQNNPVMIFNHFRAIGLNQVMTENIFKYYSEMLIIKSTYSDIYFDNNIYYALLIENSNKMEQSSLDLAKSLVLESYKNLNYTHYRRKSISLISFNNETSIKIQLTNETQANMTDFVQSKLNEIRCDYAEDRPVNIANAINKTVEMFVDFDKRMNSTVAYSIPKVMVIFTQAVIDSSQADEIQFSTKYAQDNGIKIISVGYNITIPPKNLVAINGNQPGKAMNFKPNVDFKLTYANIRSSIMMEHFQVKTVKNTTLTYRNHFKPISLFGFAIAHFYEVTKSKENNVKVEINALKGSIQNLVMVVNGINPYPVYDIYQNVFPMVRSNKTSQYVIFFNSTEYYPNYPDNRTEKFYLMVNGTNQYYEIKFTECLPSECKYENSSFTGLLVVILIALGVVFVYCCYVLFSGVYNKYQERKLRRLQLLKDHSVMSIKKNEERHQKDMTTAFT